MNEHPRITFIFIRPNKKYFNTQEFLGKKKKRKIQQIKVKYKSKIKK